jgi:hypothetical protein
MSKQLKSPRPKSPEWDAMNRRRWALIQKSVDGPISDDEAAELAELQRRTLEAVEGDPEPIQ